MQIDAERAALREQARREHARRVGRYLGGVAWEATVGFVRGIFVVPICACIWHAINPGMPLGAWMVIFAVSYAMGRPTKMLARALNRAGERFIGGWRRRLAESRAGRA
jgi:hypothetical protein